LSSCSLPRKGMAKTQIILTQKWRNGRPQVVMRRYLGRQISTVIGASVLVYSSSNKVLCLLTLKPFFETEAGSLVVVRSKNSDCTIRRAKIIWPCYD
jgi:hypothetical protein